MSNSQNIPNWLVEAREGHQQPAPPDFREKEPADILPGDICVVGPYDDRSAVGQLYLVTDVHDGWCNGMMANADVELATEFDALLSPEDAGLGYQVAIHTLYFGPIWTVQIRSRIGAIEMPVLEALEKSALGQESFEVSLRSGQPLQPEGIDPRFSGFKSLSHEFDRLTEHYRHRRDDLPPPILDPAICQENVLRKILVESGWNEKSDPATCSSEFRDELTSSYSTLDRDLQRIASRLVDKALTASLYDHSKLADFDSNVNSLTDKIDTHINSDSLAKSIVKEEAVYSIIEAFGGPYAPIVTVLSHPDCWSDREPRPVRCRPNFFERFMAYGFICDEQLQETE